MVSDKGDKNIQWDIVPLINGIGETGGIHAKE